MPVFTLSMNDAPVLYVFYPYVTNSCSQYGRVDLCYRVCLIYVLRDKSKKKKSEAIPVAGRGGLKGVEMLRISHCLDNRLIDGGKVVSPTHRSHFTPRKHFFL
jgi:hypothetical protein